MLFGFSGERGLVAVEHRERKGQGDEMALFLRQNNGATLERREPFRPFLVAESGVLVDCPVAHEASSLAGPGAWNTLATFSSWKLCQEAKNWLAKKTGFTASAPSAPYSLLGDPVQQFLTLTGRTLFLGLPFEGLRRMQVDIECVTTEGYEFCNPDRPGDQIVAIGLSDQTGWTQVLSVCDGSEPEMLEAFVRIVRERDPDVLEGHNIFNFDLPYIARRAQLHKVRLAVGRDGSTPRRRASRFSVGERTLAYERFDIHGRHVVDTLFLVHAYDISHRSLSGFGLKEVAIHFGVAARMRTYVDAAHMNEAFRADPRRVLDYVRDDVIETRELSRLLSMSNFAQAQMLPYSYQNVCVRGTATKIDALMVREYLRQGHALPRPSDSARPFSGGYTDMFVQGVVRNVHHCDVRSLYPSLMLTRKIAPRTDDLQVFLQMLEALRAFRLAAREKMKGSRTDAERTYHDALQGAFKILINSFYGYLGFAQARFNDFDAAEEVTRQGRELLRSMIAWLRQQGATPVEIDTDGIYFVPPERTAAAVELERFRETFRRFLPPGIEVEFDGEYVSMYSYKMKNYALLDRDGGIVLKGAALKSRGLEPFQRKFLRELVRLKLEGKESEIPALRTGYEQAIRGREWPIESFAKTERLQDSMSTYAEKIAKSKRARNAAYELARKSGREYQPGDQVSYYVTGEKASVTIFENARLVADWNPQRRDENVPFYLSKLEALYRKFVEAETQGELGLDGVPGCGEGGNAEEDGDES